MEEEEEEQEDEEAEEEEEEEEEEVDIQRRVRCLSSTTPPALLSLGTSQNSGASTNNILGLLSHSCLLFGSQSHPFM